MVNVAHDGHHGRARLQRDILVFLLRLGKQGVRIVELGGLATWPISSTTIIAVSWSSTWLMVTMEPSLISTLITSRP